MQKVDTIITFFGADADYIKTTLNDVDVLLSRRKGIVYLSSIYSNVRSTGNATTVLRTLCELADKAKITLHLDPFPFGTDGLSEQQLIYWYSKFGFKLLKSGRMSRYKR